MKQNLVPIYRDSEDFENGNVSYPCSTQFMVYNGLVHKYFLTEEALAYYGLDVEGKYISDNNNKVREFIELVSKKIYDYIFWRVGRKNKEVALWRVARTIAGTDAYSFRKDFEKVLVSEARWLLDNEDSARYSDRDNEKGARGGVKPEEEYWDTDDIAKEAKRSLAYMGLADWFSLARGVVWLDDNKY